MVDRSDILRCALSLRPDQLVMLRFATEVAGLKKPLPAAYAAECLSDDPTEDCHQVADQPALD